MAELIERLKAMPQSAEVVIHAYEDDNWPVNFVKQYQAFDQPECSYRGTIYIPSEWVGQDEDRSDLTPRPDVVKISHSEDGR